MKLRYKRKKVIVVGMSFGFVIVTRMLQRYPELRQKVEVLVSLVGFTHSDDFSFSRWRHWFYRISSIVMTTWPTSRLFRYLCLNSWCLRIVYAHMHNAKKKFNVASSKEEHHQIMETEIALWQQNDLRTYAYTTAELLKLDNCKVRVDVPVWHVMADLDQYFDAHLVEQHLKVTFEKVRITKAKLGNHAPSVISDPKAASELIPRPLRRMLAKLN